MRLMRSPWNNQKFQNDNYNLDTKTRTDSVVILGTLRSQTRLKNAKQQEQLRLRWLSRSRVYHELQFPVLQNVSPLPFLTSSWSQESDAI